MRYFLIDWGKNIPSEQEIFNHVQKMFGKIGIVESKFFAKDGLVGCENIWADKIRGALALKWQFKIKKISGTRKKTLQSVKL